MDGIKQATKNGVTSVEHGNLLKDISILRDHEKSLAPIMKAGKMHWNTVD